ncbi:GDP dissociation inhibitor-domain-containing protein [Favolaschia claudopus]|uniref:GDP dissociation inhibitor-domain-containing protein n=1 Tax=Favolaschia claudopus TaxID=2862362 RepID=A0AAW0DQL1_9AGAR
MSVDEGAFDVIVLGTGLTNSIVAASLSKAGFKVAHIDHNPYYGALDASLSFEELVQWQNTQTTAFSSFSRSGDTLAQSRAFSISLAPSLIPSTGPLIDALIASGVARYGGFRMIERVCVYDPSGTVKLVPGSKEDVFKNKEISLLDKRRLMRFLMFAAGDFEDKKELEGHADTPFPEYLKTVFSLTGDMINAIVYALAYCLSPNDPTLPALHRLRRYLRSAGRYGTSPFLVGHYGSAGEIAQGFCRTAAVSGGVYILGKPIKSLSASPPKHILHFEEFPEPLSCSLLISSPGYSLPSQPTLVNPPSSSSTSFSAHSTTCDVARCIAIIDRPLGLGELAPPPDDDGIPMEPVADESAPSPDNSSSSTSPSPAVLDTAVLVFPPSSLANGSSTAAATALLTGENTLSCPKGKWILYLALPLLASTPISNPETLLQPYLNAILALPADGIDTPITPLFTTFYIQHPSPPADPQQTAEAPLEPASASTAAHLAPAPLPPILPLPDAGDAAAEHAEHVFWEAVKILRPNAKEGGGDQDDDDGITSFWPPMENKEDQDEE